MAIQLRKEIEGEWLLAVEDITDRLRLTCWAHGIQRRQAPTSH
jgi:hypothetical protein